MSHKSTSDDDILAEVLSKRYPSGVGNSKNNSGDMSQTSSLIIKSEDSPDKVTPLKANQSPIALTISPPQGLMLEGNDRNASSQKMVQNGNINNTSRRPSLGFGIQPFGQNFNLQTPIKPISNLTTNAPSEHMRQPVASDRSNVQMAGTNMRPFTPFFSSNSVPRNESPRNEGQGNSYVQVQGNVETPRQDMDMLNNEGRQGSPINYRMGAMPRDMVNCISRTGLRTATNPTSSGRDKNTNLAVDANGRKIVHSTSRTIDLSPPRTPRPQQLSQQRFGSNFGTSSVLCTPRALAFSGISTPRVRNPVSLPAPHINNDLQWSPRVLGCFSLVDTPSRMATPARRGIRCNQNETPKKREADTAAGKIDRIQRTESSRLRMMTGMGDNMGMDSKVSRDITINDSIFDSSIDRDNVTFDMSNVDSLNVKNLSNVENVSSIENTSNPSQCYHTASLNIQNQNQNRSEQDITLLLDDMGHVLNSSRVTTQNHQNDRTLLIDYEREWSGTYGGNDAYGGNSHYGSLAKHSPNRLPNAYGPTEGGVERENTYGATGGDSYNENVDANKPFIVGNQSLFGGSVGTQQQSLIAMEETQLGVNYVLSSPRPAEPLVSPTPTVTTQSRQQALARLALSRHNMEKWRYRRFDVQPRLAFKGFKPGMPVVGNHNINLNMTGKMPVLQPPKLPEQLLGDDENIPNRKMTKSISQSLSFMNLSPASTNMNLTAPNPTIHNRSDITDPNTDLTTPVTGRSAVIHHADMNATNPEMNATNPEMNATNPEMNATNPEMNATNPEMNATNPEMNETNPQINPGMNFLNGSYNVPSPRILSGSYNVPCVLPGTNVGVPSASIPGTNVGSAQTIPRALNPIHPVIMPLDPSDVLDNSVGDVPAEDSTNPMNSYNIEAFGPDSTNSYIQAENAQDRDRVIQKLREELNAMAIQKKVLEDCVALQSRENTELKFKVKEMERNA